MHRHRGSGVWRRRGPTIQEAQFIYGVRRAVKDRDAGVVFGGGASGKHGVWPVLPESRPEHRLTGSDRGDRKRAASTWSSPAGPRPVCS